MIKLAGAMWRSQVLIERRAKYKCSKCRSLFPQLVIDFLEFRNWNNLQRSIDVNEIKREITEEYMKRENNKLLAEKKRKERIELCSVLIHSIKKIKAKIWRKNHADQLDKSYHKHYEIHKDKILAKQAEYRKTSGQARNERLKKSYHDNIDANRLKSRIRYWRNEQKALALLFFENDGFKAYKGKVDDVLPTWVLS